MEERVFMDQSSKPTDQRLKSALGGLYPYYKKLMEVSGSFSQDWNFSKTSGWMLKVSGKNKALFYLIPLKYAFKISMAIREQERETFLEDQELEIIHDKLKSAKKYREGFALRFNVVEDKDYKILEVLIEKLIMLRS